MLCFSLSLHILNKSIERLEEFIQKKTFIVAHRVNSNVQWFVLSLFSVSQISGVHFEILKKMFSFSFSRFSPIFLLPTHHQLDIDGCF